MPTKIFLKGPTECHKVFGTELEIVLGVKEVYYAASHGKQCS